MDSTAASAGQQQVLDDLDRAAFARGGLLALALAPGIGVAMATPFGLQLSASDTSPVDVVRRVEEVYRPRWLLWSDTPTILVEAGLRLATCWHIAAVQRLLVGGWRTDPARTWAELHDLPTDCLPVVAAADLFTTADDAEPDEPVGADGFLKPQWLEREFRWTPRRLSRWAQLALEVATMQDARLANIGDGNRGRATARSESAAELLCAELSCDGLPMDRAIAETIVASFIGPRPKTPAEAVERRRAATQRCCATRPIPGAICATLHR